MLRHKGGKSFAIVLPQAGLIQMLTARQRDSAPRCNTAFSYAKLIHINNADTGKSIDLMIMTAYRRGKVHHPRAFLECTSEASSHEVIAEVTMHQDLSLLRHLVLRQAVAEAAEVEERWWSIKVGKRIF